MSDAKDETLPHEEDPQKCEEDLEDGEIDDSDEEEPKEKAGNEVVVPTVVPGEMQQVLSKQPQRSSAQSTKKSDTESGRPSNGAPKSKKPQTMDDDFGSSIEHAIANALKKKGIEPSMPKILEKKLLQGGEHSDDHSMPAPGQGQSKSSRRRKRKKQREEKEKEKEKERMEKRKRFDTIEKMGPPSLEEEMDMDELEMLNVRGGSPPPMAAPPPALPLRLFDGYDSREDSASSYDSYESNDENVTIDRRRRRKKDARRRKDKRSDDKRAEKRSRRDSLDEKHRNDPRKLELCKFYLMSCCAKNDKCSYMHAEFPCKYYYLGMDCTSKDDCMFSHGDPLSEELRNILLRHLETAPKEILGDFKRMSRENAYNMMVKRHEELCRKFDVQNVWAPIAANALPILSNRRNKNNSNNQLKDGDSSQQGGNIPSLLDLEVKPPNRDNKSHANEGKRKSRWADGSNAAAAASVPKKQTASKLELKNLSGVISADHIEKLSKMGIHSLEQVVNPILLQLDQFGLSLDEIAKIQINALAKLGGNSLVDALSKKTAAVTDDSSTPQEAGKTSSNGDVDMRFLPATSSTAAAGSDSVPKSLDGPEKDSINSSSSNSNSGVVMVDYSQYLKDSNISFDKGDIYDDERDEEQLVIDDDNLEGEEQVSKAMSESEVENNQEDGEALKASSSSSGFASQLTGALSTDVAKTFSNPFRTGGFYGCDEKSQAEREPRKVENNFCDESKEDSYYSPSMYRSRRLSRESRSRSRTPPAEDTLNTPEASRSPEPLEDWTTDTSMTKDVVYERSTIYDFNCTDPSEDDKQSGRLKSDKDMRFLPGSSGDIDLRLPFQPMTNYTPATEIDGSITSHLPIMYKVDIVDVPRPSYGDLRQHFKSDQTTDPRLRRILGLAELSPSKTSTALSRKVRKTSNNSIASPSETEDSSPRYYTPSSAEEKQKTPTTTRTDPRTDSRAADPRSSSQRSADPRQDTRSTDPRQLSDPRRADPRAALTSATSATSATSPNNSAPSNPAGGQKQNIEIRNLLQKSEWYKNLNSKFKIMVNQQLALVSTELKKFHQDSSPNKIFDISFIVNNETLQQILTNLGIFIDDNGEVAHIEGDGDGDEEMGNDMQNMANNNIVLPNLSQPPPNTTASQFGQNNSAMDFLRAPPPNIAQGPQLIGLGPMFQRAPIQVAPFNRPSLLGLPPAQGNPMNPFNNPMSNMNFNLNPGMLGAFAGGPNFGGPGGGMPMQQRNYNNQRNNRNQNKRRI